MVILDVMGFFSMSYLILIGFLLLLLRMMESLRIVDCLFSFSIMRWYRRITYYLSKSSKSNSKCFTYSSPCSR